MKDWKELVRLGGIFLGVVAIVTFPFWVSPFFSPAQAQEAEGPEQQEVVIRPLEMFEQIKEYGDPTLKRVGKAVSIGGEIWDNPYIVQVWGEREDLKFDTKGGWDLFETWVANVPGSSITQPRGTQDLHIGVDGELAARLSMPAEAPAQFVSVPLRGGRQLGLWAAKNYLLCNPRLVKGRTTPERPTDLYVADGERVLIEFPGEYCFHLRR